MRPPTVDEVMTAAATLERMSKAYLLDPLKGSWSAEDLRGELPTIRELEREEKLYDTIVKQIVDQVSSADEAGSDLTEAVKDVLRGYEIQRKYDE